MTEPNEFLTLIKRMYRSKKPAIRGWARRLEDAYWKEKQLPLFQQNQLDGDNQPARADESGET